MPLSVTWDLLERGGFPRSHRLGLTVVDHSPVQVDEFDAINTDERREEPTILAGSILVRADLSQSVELEQRFKMPLRRDAGLTIRNSPGGISMRSMPMEFRNLTRTPRCFDHAF